MAGASSLVLAATSAPAWAQSGALAPAWSFLACLAAALLAIAALTPGSAFGAGYAVGAARSEDRPDAVRSRQAIGFPPPLVERFLL